MSFRFPVHELLSSLAHDLNPRGSISVIHEPKNQDRIGRPDWRIQDSISMGIYGYVEAKGPSNETLDITPYRNQIDRYLSLGHKLIITDGIEFVFYFMSKSVVVSLFNKKDINASDWSSLPIDPLFRFYMEQFFSDPIPQHINEEKLIELVAIRTRNLSDEILPFVDIPIDEALCENERQVISLLAGLKKLVYNHNDPNMRTDIIFSDFIAQVIMFCLLYAHRVLCSGDDLPKEKSEKIRSFAFDELPEEKALQPFRELMSYLRDNSGKETFIGQWVEECIAFLSFVQLTEKQLLYPDFHRLFELFLNKFDKKTRFDFGAFYTPKILAGFVVRFVNRIVDKYFDGATIYDEGNTIIDPCCGTGSFLEQVIAHDTSNNSYNLCGFEILPAPYMLANYRMALVEKHFSRTNLQPNIILANSLSDYLLGSEADKVSIVGKEINKAKDLCSKPIKLIIGNPPSSDSKRRNITSNYSKILSMMEDFRPPVTKRHGRQNIQKQVNNPFMKFLRWSCEKLLNSDCHSVLSFIVPLSFLEAESYKYARNYIVDHFSNIWAIAIDADARTGIRGDSLFKTMQGRAIIVLLRKAGDPDTASDYSYLDISHIKRDEKNAVLEDNIEVILRRFQKHKINDAMYSFMPARPFDEEMYARFWPISTETGNPGIFKKQCSGAKVAPTALTTHIKQQFLKRRSREICIEGVPKAREWVGRQDIGTKKRLTDTKIKAFQDALKSCKSRHELDKILTDNIRICSFRPFLNSNALIWDKIYDCQLKAGIDGARIRPEIKAVFNLQTTIGFSLSHAPKDLSTSLGQFTSFCWYFPDNELGGRRGNGHVYLNQYIPKPHSGKVINNINNTLVNHFTSLSTLTAEECARKFVFYSYAVFCSQVYLEEFYGALFTVSQSENRARIPVVSSPEVFIRLAELGEKLAVLEKKDAVVDNILVYHVLINCTF